MLKRMERKKRRNKGISFVTLFFICGVLCYLPGCGGNNTPSEHKKAKTTSKKAKAKPSSKTVEKVEKSVYDDTAYSYDPMGKKDPFLPLIKESGRITDNMLDQGPLTPLQKYSLSELRLVAVLLAGKQSKAMVEDAKGDGYILSKGTLIGDKYGEVVEIRKNEVLIAEKEIDSLSGEIVRKNVSLILHKPEEEEL